MPFSTDDIAKAGRTTLRGARLWDMHGLFGLVERDGNGARVFTQEHVERAKIIGALQMCGWPLSDIKTCSHVTAYAVIRQGEEFLRDVAASLPQDFDL